MPARPTERTRGRSAQTSGNTEERSWGRQKKKRTAQNDVVFCLLYGEGILRSRGLTIGRIPQDWRVGTRKYGKGFADLSGKSQHSEEKEQGKSQSSFLLTKGEPAPIGRRRPVPGKGSKKKIGQERDGIGLEPDERETRTRDDSQH